MLNFFVLRAVNTTNDNFFGILHSKSAEMDAMFVGFQIFLIMLHTIPGRIITS